MADLKISQLTGATTPLAGTEVLPIVQSGSTVKVSVANLTAGRAVGMAGGSFTDNITQSTAAKGVNFTANTPAAGMTSQLLNWYEEGTWTPVLSDGTNNATMSGGTAGRYTRVGRQVSVTAYIAVTSLGSASGAVLITGLPFTVNSSDGARGSASIGYASGLSILAGSSITAVANSSSTRIAMQYWSAITGTSNLSFAQLTSSTEFFMSCVYYV